MKENRAEKINRLRAELDKTEKELTQFESLSVEQQLAEILHANECHHNHTDACDWCYGSWENDNYRYAREEYLKRAKYLLDMLGGDYRLTQTEILKLAESWYSEGE